jgi:hypothetical protein
MQLIGNKLLLNKPTFVNIEEITSEEEKATAIANIKAAWESLEVFAIGTEVVNFAIGSKVLISKETRDNTKTVEINGVPKLLISEYEVLIKWS